MRFLPLLLLASCLAVLPAANGGDLELSRGATVHEVTAAPNATGPRVLCVIAHPDDEVAFAATLYKTATLLNGVVDIVVITNGEGGFKYATLAESIYGRELTAEAIGRARLPAIRRKEQIAGCRIMQVRRLFALNQKDHRYTRDLDEIFGSGAKVWDLEAVRKDLRAIVEHGRYDFVFTHVPVPTTHAHHQAATVLALEAVAAGPEAKRPVVLGAALSEDAEPFAGLEGHPITRLRPDRPPFVFDRTQSFGYKDRLNYKIIVNWVIAEHKSQGTMQLYMNRGDEERYWLYDRNPKGAVTAAREFFRKLAAPQFKTKHYGPSAGVK
jgi:LmbE family N-acetylglucosaminyl deacetylase